MFKKIALQAVIFCGFFANAWAEEFNIKYSSNYIMPAYVHFKTEGNAYRIQAKINVPLYNIIFNTTGYIKDEQLHLVRYQDNRNGKNYAVAELNSQTIKYGKTKDPLKTEPLNLPTFDLFSLAFQLSRFDKLPPSFQTTNGKKLYPAENVVLDKKQRSVKFNGKAVEEITYKFKTGDKFITVKKHVGETFPRYIAYSRDGDDYELTFDEFVK